MKQSSSLGQQSTTYGYSTQRSYGQGSMPQNYGSSDNYGSGYPYRGTTY